VALRLVNTNGNLKGSFSVGFGLAVDVLITPGKGAVLTLSTGSATVHFTAPSDIAGSFSKASGSRYGLDVAGYRLTEGSIIWNNDRFALAGGVNFGLVKADVTGGLGAEGLSLSGRYEVGVTLPTIGLLGVAVRIDISQQGVGVRLTLPGKIENQGAIAVFGKKLCTLVHLSTPLKDFWLAIPLGGLPVVYWSRPAGWPLDGAAPVRAAAPMAVRVAYASPAHVGANLSALSLPDSVTPLPHRDVTGALLDAVAVALGGGETSEQGSESIFQTLEAYRASSGDAGGPVTGGRWVTVCRSEAHEDFFTESVTRVGAGDLNVATASATFEQHGASPGGPGLTMTLQVLLKGQNASAVVTLDPKDLSGAYRAIAEQLRSS
jgi:hypothetical protein